jgi:predicted DNA binding CopG/RHH family protein
MSKRKSKRGDYEIEDLGDLELAPDMDAKVQKLTAAADEELEATRVNFRWQREPLKLIKAVAAAMGIPYQTYMKQVLYRQALDDLGKIQSSQMAATNVAKAR